MYTGVLIVEQNKFWPNRFFQRSHNKNMQTHQIHSPGYDYCKGKIMNIPRMQLYHRVGTFKKDAFFFSEQKVLTDNQWLLGEFPAYSVLTGVLGR